MLRKQFGASIVQEGYFHQPLGQFQRQFHRLGNPGPGIFTDLDPVHHQQNGMAEVLFQLGRVVQLHQLPVHHRPDKALGQVGSKQFLEFPFPVPHQGRADHDPGPFRQRGQGFSDLGGGLGGDGLAAAGTMGFPCPGKQHAEIIINFGHRGHGGPGIPVGGFLLNGNGRGQAFNQVHVRFFHPV